MTGEQLGLLIKLFSKLSIIIDGGYNYALYRGAPPVLPYGLSPSDIPGVGDSLDQLDLLDDTAHITKETIILKITCKDQNSPDSDVKIVKFKTLQ